MIVLAGIETLLLVLLSLLVVGLLRSHAEILRRLDELSGASPPVDLRPQLPPAAAADAEARGREDLNPLAAVRRIGDDERAVRLDGERGRIDDASRFRTDLNDLPRAVLLLVESEHRMRSPIEHEVLAGRRLLKSDRLTESAGDVRGHSACRTQHLRLYRADRRCEEQQEKS